MKKLLMIVGLVIVAALGAVAFVSLNTRVERIEHSGGAYTENFYWSGKLAAERNYADDHLQGTTMIYYADGSIKAEIPFANGLKEGTAKQYDSEGNLKYRDEYVQGNRVKREKFDKKGNLIS